MAKAESYRALVKQLEIPDYRSHPLYPIVRERLLASEPEIAAITKGDKPERRAWINLHVHWVLEEQAELQEDGMREDAAREVALDNWLGPPPLDPEDEQWAEEGGQADAFDGLWELSRAEGGAQVDD